MNKQQIRLSMAVGILIEIRPAISNRVNDPSVMVLYDEAILLIERAQEEADSERGRQRAFQAFQFLMKVLEVISTVSKLGD